jgi:hypothetical protein
VPTDVPLLLLRGIPPLPLVFLCPGSCGMNVLLSWWVAL